MPICQADVPSGRIVAAEQVRRSYRCRGLCGNRTAATDLFFKRFLIHVLRPTGDKRHKGESVFTGEFLISLL